MENYIFIVNTLIGFLGALLWDILQRKKASESSPKSFSIKFFVKDNTNRLIVTLLLSIVVMLGIYLNIADAGKLFGKELTELNSLIYLVVGAAPDLIISFAKRKTGFLQVEKTDGFTRK